MYAAGGDVVTRTELRGPAGVVVHVNFERFIGEHVIDIVSSWYYCTIV